MNEKKLVSVKEFSSIFGVSRQAILRRIKTGTIKANKIGNYYVLDLNDYLN